MSLQKTGPYLTAAVCLFPAVSRISGGFSPITYQRVTDLLRVPARPTASPSASPRSVTSRSANWASSLLRPSWSLRCEITDTSRGRSCSRDHRPRFDRRFVAAFALAPIIVTWIFATLTGMSFQADWSYAMWSFTGLFAVVFVVPSVSEGGLKRFLGAWVMTFGLVATAYAAANTLAPHLSGRLGVHLFARSAKESAFPAEDLAEVLTQSWHAKVGTPIAYVIGSKWIAGHVSFFSGSSAGCSKRDCRQLPMIDVEDVNRRGALVVWNPEADFKAYGTCPSISYPGTIQHSYSQQWRFSRMSCCLANHGRPTAPLTRLGRVHPSKPH